MLDEIIKETKKCEDAGLRAMVYENVLGDIVIRCKPKLEERRKTG